MAKDRERKLFEIYFIDHGLTAKEAAKRVDVTEKTASDWVGRFHMKERRDAKNASPAKRLGNIKEIISCLSNEWLNIDRQIKELEAKGSQNGKIAGLRTRIKGIGDDVSKWNKTLENVEKESQVPLATYIHVMEDIFQALLSHDRDIYMNLVDFQEQHLNAISEKLG